MKSHTGSIRFITESVITLVHELGHSIITVFKPWIHCITWMRCHPRWLALPNPTLERSH